MQWRGRKKILVKVVHCLICLNIIWYPNDFQAVQKMKVAKAAAGMIMATRPWNDRRLSKLEEEFKKMT